VAARKSLPDKHFSVCRAPVVPCWKAGMEANARNRSSLATLEAAGRSSPTQSAGPAPRPPGPWRAPHGAPRGMGAYARHGPSARRFCAGGHCVGLRSPAGPAGGVFLDAASRQLFGMGSGRQTTTPGLTTHADILRCYDLAIAMAEGESRGARCIEPEPRNGRAFPSPGSARTAGVRTH